MIRKWYILDDVKGLVLNGALSCWDEQILKAGRGAEGRELSKRIHLNLITSTELFCPRYQPEKRALEIAQAFSYLSMEPFSLPIEESNLIVEEIKYSSCFFGVYLLILRFCMNNWRRYYNWNKLECSAVMHQWSILERVGPRWYGWYFTCCQSGVDWDSNTNSFPSRPPHWPIFPKGPHY